MTKIKDIETLIAAIRSGSLPVTQANLKKVHDAWSTMIVLDAALKEALLDHLPDPEATDLWAPLLEDWIAAALVSRSIYPAAETRKRLRSARRKILRSHGLQP